MVKRSCIQLRCKSKTFALSRHHDIDKHDLKKKSLLLYKALHENNKYTRFTYLVWRFPFTLAHQSVTLLYVKFGTPASKRVFLSRGSTKKGKGKEIREELCEIIAGYFFIRVFLHSTYLQYENPHLCRPWHRKMSMSHTFWRPSFSFSLPFFLFERKVTSLTQLSDAVSAKGPFFCDQLPLDIWKRCKDELLCLKCAKKYSDWRSLRKHMNFFCQMEPLYPCPYCMHRARIPTLLKYHVLREHAACASMQEIY